MLKQLSTIALVLGANSVLAADTTDKVCTTSSSLLTTTVILG